MGRTRWSTSMIFALLVFFDVIETTLGSCRIPDEIPNTIMRSPADESIGTALGTYISWTCAPGYTMSGFADTVVWVCSTNGQWMGMSPNCSALTCPSPPIPAFASVTPDGLAKVNESIAYTCRDGYTRILEHIDNMCNARGLWENPLPLCQKDCQQHNNMRRYSNHTCFRRRGRENWGKSAELCAGKEETLATVKDEDTQTFLSNVLKDISGQSVWIGAREGRDWKWNNSAEYIRTLYWQQMLPDTLRPAKSCIEVAYDAEPDHDDRYAWSASACDKLNGIICQYASPCRADEATVKVDYRGNCFHFLEERMSWADGSSYCSQMRGHLAEILDKSTNDLLTTKALELNEKLGSYFSWWIGGYDDDESEKSWFWILDNTRVDYQPWISLPLPNGECVEMNESDGYRWNAVGCSKKRHTLCQIGMDACGDPGEPLNGRRTPDDRTTFAVAATMEFVCHEGYELVGPEVINCRTNGTWDGEKPICQAVHCLEDVPSLPHGGNVTKLSNAYKGVAVYICEEGYIPTNSPISVCLHNATWSRLEFACEAIPGCYEEPCQNGGTCLDKAGGEYSCLCRPDFQGPTCENEREPFVPMTSSLPPDEPTGGVTTTESEPEPNSGIAAIVSTVIVLLAVVVAMVLVIVLLLRRKRTRSAGKKNDLHQNEMHHYATAENNYASKGEIIVPSDGSSVGGQNGGLHAGNPSWIEDGLAPNAARQQETDLSDYVYYQYGADVAEEEIEDKEQRPQDDSNHRDNIPDVVKGIQVGQGKERNEKVGGVSQKNDGGDDDAYEEMEDEMVVNELYNPLPDDSTGRVSDQIGGSSKSEEGNLYDSKSAPFSDISTYQAYDKEPGNNSHPYQTLRFDGPEHSDGLNPAGHQLKSGVEANAKVEHVYELEDAVAGESEDDYVNTDYHAEPSAMVANDLYHSVDNYI